MGGGGRGDLERNYICLRILLPFTISVVVYTIVLYIIPREDVSLGTLNGKGVKISTPLFPRCKSTY